MKDIYHDTAVVNLMDVTALAHADQSSNLLDTQGFEGAMIIAMVEDLTGADASNYTVPTLEECDTTTGTSFTAVAAADMITEYAKIDAAGEDKVAWKACYLGSKRYIRVTFDTTSAGTYPTGNVKAIGILRAARHGPATAPAPLSAV
jgi:hypothetical protein